MSCFQHTGMSASEGISGINQYIKSKSIHIHNIERTAKILSMYIRGRSGDSEASKRTVQCRFGVIQTSQYRGLGSVQENSSVQVWSHTDISVQRTQKRPREQFSAGLESVWGPMSELPRGILYSTKLISHSKTYGTTE